MVLLTVVATATVMYVLMSFVEWLLHRKVMHLRGLPRWAYSAFPSLGDVQHAHAVQHHVRFYNQFDHEPDFVGRHYNITLDVALGVVGLAPLWGAFLLLSVAAGVTALACVLLHHLTWNLIHNEMHNPSGARWAKTRLFKYLARYHYLHHAHPARNYNVVCPLADWVLGTRAAEDVSDIIELSRLDLL
jgi:hypothetical protein